MTDERESNPRAAQVRIEANTARTTSGQRKHDLRIGPQPDYVDDSRLHLNRTLIAPLTGPKMRDRALERRNRRPRQRAMKANAAVSMRGIITFGHLAQDMFDALTTDQQDAAIHDLASQIADRLRVDLTGLVIHADETALHAHFQIDSYDNAGNSLSDMMKRQQLREIQDLTAEVMAAHCPGIERGASKVKRLKAGAKPEDVTNKRPNQLRREQTREIEKLQSRIDKLKAYGDELTEKGAAQLATAERRLAAKQAEIARASETASLIVTEAREEATRIVREAQERIALEYELLDAEADARETEDRKRMNRDLDAHIARRADQRLTEAESRATRAEKQATEARREATEAHAALRNLPALWKALWGRLRASMDPKQVEDLKREVQDEVQRPSRIDRSR